MSQSTLAATGHSTAVPAPAHFRAVVDHDGSITTSWDPVAGATYTLKEKNKSPNGVQGAIGITATTSVRHPSGHGVYEYYVVAVRKGVESADSAHVTVDLSQDHAPAPTPGLTPSTGSTPWEILQIGGAGGNWNLGVGLRPEDGDKIVTVKPDALRTYDRGPYFTPVAGGTRVQFQAFMTGGIRKPDGHGHGSWYTRTEMRELTEHGENKAWDVGTGLHVLSGTTAVMHLPPKQRWICVAQIHGTKSDTLELRVEGEDGNETDGFSWVVSFSDGNQENSPTDKSHKRSGYRLGDEFDWEIRVDGHTLTVQIDGTAVFHEDVSDISLGDQYFKTGCYNQSSAFADHGENEESEYERITLRNLRLSHP